ncbi:MAG: hypothetical protein KJ811_05680, partial [Candidatus Margulisbacteria bacterium]|nr:hypothetical protein [Candidatus Margulisiibacteriota bacterium]
MKMKRDFKNILIIRPDAIGDLCLMTPAFKALRQKFPEATLTLFTRSYAQDLFENTSLLDELIIDEGIYNLIFHRQKISRAEYAKYIKIFKEKNFDLIIHANDLMPYNLMGFFAKIPYRLGDKARISTNLLQNLRSLQRWKDITRHECEQNLLMLEALGIRGEPEDMEIKPAAASLTKIKQVLASNNIKENDLVIGLHVGTGTGNKSWNPTGYPELVNKILEKYPQAKVVLSGGQDQIENTKEVK